MKFLTSTVVLIIGLSFLVTNCQSPEIGPNRGRLLDPTMDPGKGNNFLNGAKSEPTILHEKGNPGGGTMDQTSCPTCG